MVTPMSAEVATSNNHIPTAAGNMRCYYNSKKITGNSFLLRIVGEGYSIQFISKTAVNNPIISNPSSAEKILALKQQIANHFETGAISKIEKSSHQFVSRVFTIKKSNGDDRLIIDLSLLNNFILKTHFRMEIHVIIKSLIQKDDNISSIDLSDAFFSISCTSCKE